jgi:V/A-type H+-transporting ATPase subunit I
MANILMVGPRPLLPAVIAAVQRAGRVHLATMPGTAAGVATGRLSPDEDERRSLLEKAAAAIDGLLSLLGHRGPPAPTAVVADWASLEQLLRERQEQARALVRGELELRDELALIASYQSALEALSPLLTRLEGSAKLRAFGFVARGADAAAVEPVRRELAKATAGRCELYAQALGDGRVAALVAYHAADADRVRGFFSKAGINELKLPSTVAELPVPEAVRQLKRKLHDLPQRIRAARTEIRALADQWGPELAGWRRQAADELARFDARGRAGEGRFSFSLRGYLPQDDLPALQDALRAQFKDAVTVQLLEIGHHDAPRVPVTLRNNPVVRPFELLLSIFNPPQYGAVDPTPFIAFFFPFFFGFIVGDIGYGAVMSLAVAVIWLKYRSSRLARSLATIFGICALWTIVWGFVYGELFGDFGEHMHWIKPVSESMNRLSTESIMSLFQLSLVIGFVQVYVGYGIMLYNGIKHRNLHHVLEPIAFALGVVAVFGIFFTVMVKVLPVALMWPSVVVAGVCAVTLGILAGVAGPIEIFGNVGNILSYARLFAIGLSAAYLAYAANLIGRTIGGVAGFLVAALVIHPLFFALGLISPIMQPFRLQVVEFFTKFKYHDYPGKQYKPFKTTGETP